MTGADHDPAVAFCAYDLANERRDVGGRSPGPSPDRRRCRSRILHLGVTPTVLRRGPYRFFFYSDDRSEPSHVHVRREARHAKFWLDPVSVAVNHGFAQHELNRIEAIVSEHRDELMEVWNGFFSD